MWEYADDHIVYGIPNLGRGVKAGLHESDTQVAHPDAVDREPTDLDVERIRDVLRRLLPDTDGPVIHATTCFYTSTPDRHYLIDRPPELTQVAYASACSGHRFKASPAIGEAVADLALDQPTQIDIEPFRFRWYVVYGRIESDRFPRNRLREVYDEHTIHRAGSRARCRAGSRTITDGSANATRDQHDRDHVTSANSIGRSGPQRSVGLPDPDAIRTT